ncbi:hypothetical protein G5C65_38290, partial [Streptomyces sp. SB3404]
MRARKQDRSPERGATTAPARPGAALPPLAALQRAAGNQAVTRTIQRAPQEGRPEAQGSQRSVSEWKRRAQAVNEFVKSCTCEQNMFQYGRVEDEVVVRYRRSYKHQRDEQSLRHAVRRLLSASAWLEEQGR